MMAAIVAKRLVEPLERSGFVGNVRRRLRTPIGGGLGDAFRSATGLDPLDPKNCRRPTISPSGRPRKAAGCHGTARPYGFALQ
jgi:hypothetical protein